MLESVLKDKNFSKLMKKHIFECIDYLLKEKISFSIVVNLEFVKFDPELPDEIKKKFGKNILFTLAGYTFESARLESDLLSFEAGFGANDYASTLFIPLGAIIQIVLEDTPILLNFSIHSEKNIDEKSGIEKSKQLFASNPNNKL